MTREHKLALIVGFALVLVLGVLISDHFSKARQVQLAGAGDIRPPTPEQLGTAIGTPAPIGASPAATPPQSIAGRPDLPGFARTRGNESNLPSTILVASGPTPSTPLANVHHVNEYLPYGEHTDLPSGSAPVVPISPPLIPMTRYDVKDGDTLYAIAQRTYGDGKLWEKIRDSNKDKLGSGGTLHKGVTLLLPPKDVLLGKPYIPPTQANSLIAQRTTPLDLIAKPDAKPAANGDFREYQVKDGDTLVAIARKMLNSGKRYTEIIDANKSSLADPESLTVGMKLRVPVK